MSRASRRAGKELPSLTPLFRPGQVEKLAPCQEGCPISGDIRRWVGIVAQRDKLGLAPAEAYARAWGVIVERNPLPSTLGRVCPHPCETNCNRSGLDEGVAIHSMERFLGDWAISEGLPLTRLEEDEKPESIGVIGSGPSGLSFAYQMARRGYCVTIYEQHPQAGGMLRYGIPDYRLPRDVLDAEIDRIARLGVDIRLNTTVGSEISLGELRARHAALYVAIGAQSSRELGIAVEADAAVMNGAEYLRRVNRGEHVEVGKKVAVIGGGNTAVDAARTARRARCPGHDHLPPLPGGDAGVGGRDRGGSRRRRGDAVVERAGAGREARWFACPLRDPHGARRTGRIRTTSADRRAALGIGAVRGQHHRCCFSGAGLVRPRGDPTGRLAGP